MSIVETPSRIIDEVAELFASAPHRDQILTFRPSSIVQERARVLLNKSADGELTDEELQELEQFHLAEMLVRLVKARLR